MEPVTHVLTGACLARAGFNRRAAYATLTMALAAEMPDIDVLWRVRGPVESFAHHRGITHTFLGLPFEAAVLVGAVYGLHRWRVARSQRRSEAGTTPITRPLTVAPVRWWWLYLCALVALLSHLALDYTNSYGIRPFYPFNGHWYAASIVFIFDPIIFTLLLIALVVPPLFGLVNAEVGGKRQRFRGRGMAIGALVCVVALWVFRYVQHSKAEEIAFGQTYEVQAQSVSFPDAGIGPIPTPTPLAAGAAADESSDKGDAPTDSKDNAATPDTEPAQPPAKLLQVQRVAVSPDPVNPFHWSVAMDYGTLYQLATVDVRSGAISPDQVTYPKVSQDAVLRAAQASPLGRAYLDWSAMPIVSEEEPVVASRPDGKPVNRVTFRDPRFMGDVSWLRLSSGTPLTAVITVDDSGQVVRQVMDGAAEPAGRGAIADVHWNLGGLGRGASTDRPVAPRSAPAHSVKTEESHPVQATPRPEGVAPSKPAPSEPKPVLIAPAVAKIEPPAPAPQPVGVKPVIPQPEPKPAQTEPITAPAPSQPVQSAKPVKAKPQAVQAKSEPSIFERAYAGLAARVHRFQSWLHWLANPR